MCICQMIRYNLTICSSCFFLYAFVKRLLTGSCTVHRRKFPYSLRYISVNSFYNDQIQSCLMQLFLSLNFFIFRYLPRLAVPVKVLPYTLYRNISADMDFPQLRLLLSQHKLIPRLFKFLGIFGFQMTAHHIFYISKHIMPYLNTFVNVFGTYQGNQVSPKEK